jgi:osmotically-inducible protein OsmY
MKNLGLLLFVGGVVVFMLVSGSCSTATNTNTSSNVRNSNNTAVLVNATATPVATRSNSSISREEYDKNRAEYERDKGSSTIGQGVNDSWIWFKTRTALAAADNLRDSTINVDVVNDIITLRGTVASAAQKNEAETVAKSIEGQKGVKNELIVRPSDSMTNQMVNGNSSTGNKSNSNKK